MRMQKRWVRLTKYYAIAVVLSLTTVWFGHGLLQSGENVIDRLDLFEPVLDKLMGWWMIGAGVLKLVALYIRPKWVKKWSLIAIMMAWSVVTWAYMQNSIPNMGYRMSLALVLIAMIELYRGDFHD